MPPLSNYNSVRFFFPSPAVCQVLLKWNNKEAFVVLLKHKERCWLSVKSILPYESKSIASCQIPVQAVRLTQRVWQLHRGCLHLAATCKTTQGKQTRHTNKPYLLRFSTKLLQSTQHLTLSINKSHFNVFEVKEMLSRVNNNIHFPNLSSYKIKKQNRKYYSQSRALNLNNLHHLCFIASWWWEAYFLLIISVRNM